MGRMWKGPLHLDSVRPTLKGKIRSVYFHSMAAISITTVRAANAQLKSLQPGYVAFFVGATNGIGASALHSFVEHFNAPKVYVVGRSKAKVAEQLAALQRLNPRATIIFIENEISLLNNVDHVCEQIKGQEKSLDLLYMSAGYLAFGEARYTSEGIDTCFSLSYYTRMRFALNLLPLISKSRAGRILSVLSGGQERGLIKVDLGLKNNYSVINVVNQSTTMHTLAFEYFAKLYPGVSFIHVYPGWVKTDIFRNLFQSSSGCLFTLAQWTLVPLFGLVATSVEESGERQVFHASDSRYAASSIPNQGQALRVGAKGEIVVDDRVLGHLRAEGWREKVWEHTEHIWEEALQMRMNPSMKVY